MKEYVANLMENVRAKNPAQPEFHQAVEEVADSVALVLEQASSSTAPRRSSSASSSPSA